MSQEHYFSADPSKPATFREIEFDVGGKGFRAMTASGTFSITRLDPGTKILLENYAEFPEEGNVLDLGCGWGPISLAIAGHSQATTVWALDVNQRSLQLVAENSKTNGLANIKAVTQDQIPDGIKFTGIWSNPPIRVGKVVLHELLETWLPRLEEGGRAMLVVQKQLGADSLLAWIQERFPDLTATRFSTDKGYRILEVVR